MEINMLKKFLDTVECKTFLFITLAILSFECYNLERKIKEPDMPQAIEQDNTLNIEQMEPLRSYQPFFFDYVPSPIDEGLV